MTVTATPRQVLLLFVFVPLCREATSPAAANLKAHLSCQGRAQLNLKGLKGNSQKHRFFLKKESIFSIFSVSPIFFHFFHFPFSILFLSTFLFFSPPNPHDSSMRAELRPDASHQERPTG